MSETKKALIVFVILLLVAVGVIFFLRWQSAAPQAPNTKPIPGQVERVSIQREYDKVLSLRSFSPGEVKQYDFNNKVIYGSFFGQELPDTHIFPDNLKGATFINCNLDNVFIPEGNTVIMDGGGSRRKFKVQNDLEDWLLNEDGSPKEPVNKEKYLELGLSIDPKDLPKNQLEENIINLKLREIQEAAK